MWTKKVNRAGELFVVNGEPALVSTDSRRGDVHFVGPPGTSDVTVSTNLGRGLNWSTETRLSAWVDDRTLYLDDPTMPTAVAITDHIARTITKWDPDDDTTTDPDNPSPHDPQVLNRNAETIRSPSEDSRPTVNRSPRVSRSGDAPEKSIDITGMDPASSPGGRPLITGNAVTPESPLPGPTTTVVLHEQPKHPRVTAISAGADQTCALIDDGTVKCWGSMSGKDTSLVPQRVFGLEPGARAITLTGGLSCAELTDSTTKCWGFNPFSDFLDDTWSTSTSPRTLPDVPGMETSTVRTSGVSCALTPIKGVKCWGVRGANYLSGQLGSGWWVITDDPSSPTGPVDVIDLNTAIRTIAIGTPHALATTCVLTTVGGVSCWGAETNDWFSSGSFGPVEQIDRGTHMVSVSDTEACALMDSGRVRCWSYQPFNKLTTVWPTNPREVARVTSGVSLTMFQLASNGTTACVLTSAGAVECWEVGASEEGEVRVVPGLESGVAAITSGYDHACALTTDGSVKCWGKNDGGQLGNGTTVDSLIPLDVTGLS